MHRGYVKLWRKSFDSIIWKNQRLWRFWTWCLMKATHIEFMANIDYDKIDLEPGQFLFGRKKCSKETGLSEQTIRTCISKLSGNKLVVKSTNKYSIITIVNWESYQQPKTESNQQVTSKQPASNQQVTTYKNVEAHKNEKKTTIDHPSWLNLPLWKEFKKYRTKIKAPLTDHAEKLCLVDLKKVIDEGCKQTDIINQTIMSGKWKSFYPVKSKKGSVGLTYTKQPICSRCGMTASNIKKGRECPFCREVA